MSKQLEELQNELDIDSAINGLQLQSESANIPIIWSKWLRYLSSYKKDLIKAENTKSLLLLEKLQYYTGRGDQICDVVYEKSELKVVFSGDTDLIKADSRIRLIELLIEFCSKALDVIKNKGYSIKNMIEIRQMEQGL